jgi:hypothetical protein
MPAQRTTLLRCSRCTQKKPQEAFHRASTARGCQNYCKDCHREHGRERWARMTPMERTRRKKATHLKGLYGITLDEYDQIAAQQNGVCAICGNPEPHFGFLAVDHCHTTGSVRGLLCGPCNMGIGQLGEDAQRLEAAAAYLRKHLP